MSEPEKGFTETLQTGKERWEAVKAALIGLTCQIGETTGGIISVAPSLPEMEPGVWWEYFTGYDSDGENPQTVMALKNAGISGGYASYVFRGVVDDGWSVVGDWMENYLHWKTLLETTAGSGDGALGGMEALEAAVEAMQEWLNEIRPWKERGGKGREGIW